MEKERRALQAYAVSLVLMILIIALGYMGLKLKDTQERLIELESGTSERMDMQQEQLNNLQTDYDSLASSTDALAQHVENLGKDLQETKQIQSNTNKALTRLRKQKEELEKRFEEEIEHPFINAPWDEIDKDTGEVTAHHDHPYIADVAEC